MEGGGSPTEESTFQLGGVESVVRSFASYHYCFSESDGGEGGGGGGGSRAYG